jgi:hypothetical protein
VESGDFDPEDVRDAQMGEACPRWEKEKTVFAHPATPFDLDGWLSALQIEVLKRKPDGTVVIVCPGTHGDYDKRDAWSCQQDFTIC